MLMLMCNLSIIEMCLIRLDNAGVEIFHHGEQTRPGSGQSGVSGAQTDQYSCSTTGGRAGGNIPVTLW